MLPRINYLLIFLTVNGIAQKSEKFEVNAGYGFYDALNMGISYNFKNATGLGCSIGYDNHFLSDEKYLSAKLEFMIAIFRKAKTFNERYQYWFHNRIYFWSLEDNYYRWQAITYNPCFVYRFDLNSKIYISIIAGPAINFVVYNYRKTFDEVGWPHYVQFNPGIQLNYIFTK